MSITLEDIKKACYTIKTILRTSLPVVNEYIFVCKNYIYFYEFCNKKYSRKISNAHLVTLESTMKQYALSLRNGHVKLSFVKKEKVLLDLWLCWTFCWRERIEISGIYGWAVVRTSRTTFLFDCRRNVQIFPRADSFCIIACCVCIFHRSFENLHLNQGSVIKEKLSCKFCAFIFFILAQYP